MVLEYRFLVSVQLAKRAEKRAEAEKDLHKAQEQGLGREKGVGGSRTHLMISIIFR